MNILKIGCTLLFSLFMLTAYAHSRPTIEFNGQKYYLVNFYNELDGTYTPINVIEWYLPEGETSDNYTKFIKRIIFLQVNDYKASAYSQLHEHKEDNNAIPAQLFDDLQSKKTVVNVAFWWPFRPSLVYKYVYVFQMDKKANRAMCYIYGELRFNNNKVTDTSLREEGKSLLLDEKIVNQVKALDF